MKKSITNLIQKISNQLQDLYPSQELQRQYAWWMLEAITKKNRAELLAKQYILFSKEEEKKLNLWLDKQVNESIPLQYLLKSVPFCSLNILVEPPVIIPRIETEHWCCELILQLKKIKDKKIKILDMCSGTGCIGLAIAASFPNFKVYSADISQKALNLALKNVKHNKITNLYLIKTDIFKNIPKNKKFDLIVSNPPYVDEQDWESLSPTIKNWEDPNAIISQKSGLKIIERIINQAKQYLEKNNHLQQNNIPQIIIEIGEKQAEKVSQMLLNANFKNIKTIKDLSGKDRVISAEI